MTVPKVVAFSVRNALYAPFRLQRRVLRFMGYYPGDEHLVHWAWGLALIFHISSQIFLSVSESMAAWRKLGGGDVMTALQAFCPVPSRLNVVLKYFYLVSKRKQLKKLQDKLLELYDHGEPREKPSNEWAAYWGYQFTYWEFMFTHLTAAFYLLIPVAAMLYNYIMDPTAARIYLLPFEMVLPYDYCKSPVFEMTYAVLSYIAYPPVFLMAGCDGLFIGVCLLVSSQYRNVQLELEALGQSTEEGTKDGGVAAANAVENERIFEQLKLIAQRHNRTIEIAREMSDLFLSNVFASFTIAAIKLGLSCITVMLSTEEGTKDGGVAAANAVENERIFEQLKLIAQRHNRTIEIAREMSDLFLSNVFASFTIAAIKLGLSCITVMLAQGFTKLIFIWYTLGILTEIYVYSFGGTQLMKESEKIRQSAYDFPWYRYRTNVRQVIQMMMLRANKPSRVEVPFFEASVAAFATILRTAGSYVTLMQTFL